MVVERRRLLLGVIPLEKEVIPAGEQVSITRKEHAAIVTRTFTGRDGPGALMYKYIKDTRKTALGDPQEVDSAETRFVKPGKSYAKGIFIREKITVR